MAATASACGCGGIALGTAILLSHLAMTAGLLDAADVFYLSNWSIAGAVIGGLLFGVGMALAGQLRLRGAGPDRRRRFPVGGSSS